MHLANSIKYLFFILILYIYFFQPQLKALGANIPSSWLLYPIAIFLLLLNGSKKFSPFYRKFHAEVVFIILIFLYTFLRVVFGGDVETLKKNLLSILELIFVPYAIIMIGNRLRLYSIKDFFNVFFITATIAIGISILCLLIPSLHNYVRENIMMFSENVYLYDADYRGFGIAAQLTSHYSFSLGIMISLCLFYRGDIKWFMYVIPFAFIAIMVNARTGVLVGMVGFFVLFLQSTKRFLALFFLVIGIFLYMNLYDILLLFNISDQTARWVSSFYQQMEMISEGNTDQSILVTYQRMIVFPENFFDWIVGMGISIFHGGTVNGAKVNSDIGFINQLLFGGLIYVSILYSLVFYMSRRLRRTGNKEYSLYLITIFLLINFKGDFLLYTPSFKLVILTYYIIITNSVEGIKRLDPNRIGMISPRHY